MTSEQPFFDSLLLEGLVDINRDIQGPQSLLARAERRKGNDWFQLKTEIGESNVSTVELLSCHNFQIRYNTKVEATLNYRIE